jgi:precorrin-6x reductase
MRVRRVLVLGGTTEAGALAQRLAGLPDVTVISSLAGRTAQPAPLPGELRIGGFGGAAGLAAYLAEARIDAVVDATHPFAAVISRRAMEACRQRPTPRLVRTRPPWQPGPGDRWLETTSLNEAAGAIPENARAFLTIGRQGLACFGSRPDVWFLVRVITRSRQDLPLFDAHEITGRGPFAPPEERRLMVEHRIDCLATKNSGGEATVAKLVAARELGIPVIMVSRPELPAGDRASTVGEALAWLARL